MLRVSTNTSLIAHQLHCGAVRKQAHVGQRDPLAGPDRLHHRVRIVHLHANHPHFGPHRLDVVRHARDQTAAANGDKHRIQPVVLAALAPQSLHLAQNLHRDGALAGDHVRVVKRMDEGQAVLFLEHRGVAVGIGIAVTMQHHLAAQGLDRIDLEPRRGHRHHDHSAAVQPPCAERNPLRVVAGGRADHAVAKLPGAQVRHLVVSAAQLEAEHRLLVLALEQHRVVQPPAEGFGGLQCRLDGHVVDPCGQNLLQVVGWREFGGGKRCWFWLALACWLDGDGSGDGGCFGHENPLPQS